MKINGRRYKRRWLKNRVVIVDTVTKNKVSSLSKRIAEHTMAMIIAETKGK